MFTSFDVMARAKAGTVGMGFEGSVKIKIGQLGPRTVEIWRSNGTRESRSRVSIIAATVLSVISTSLVLVSSIGTGVPVYSSRTADEGGIGSHRNQRMAIPSTVARTRRVFLFCGRERELLFLAY
jgi:hypothetical protein